MATIASNRKAEMAVVVAENAPQWEQYAARELRSYLQRITCASFALETAPYEGPQIAVGQAAYGLGMEEDPTLGADGFRIATFGDRVGIIGGQRGVIYGVYEYLERLGCRFFTPLCEKIPTQTTLALPDIQDRQVPVLEYRLHNYRDFARNPRFAVKSRINDAIDAAYPIPAYMGGSMSYAWFVHTYRRILKPEDVFAEHPEYFSMVDGKRIFEQTQLCLTNPDVLRIAIEKVRQVLREKPDCRLVSISQNDWYNPCQCPECAKIDLEEGSSAGTLLRFVNTIAETLEPEFPDVVFDTLAYQYTRPAPNFVRPRHNVCVRLCSIEACFAHPLDACEDESRHVTHPDGKKSSFIRDLEDWGKVCNRLYIWDYTTNFCQYPQPYPNWNVLQPNMRAFIRNNVKGVFEQACGAKGGGVDFNELRAYLISKLLWNADCDLERHKREFMEYFYGPAAPYLEKYLRMLTDYVEEHRIHIGFNDNCDKPYFAPELLDAYDALFDQAEAAVRDDPIRAMRVARNRLSIRWVRLKNDAMLRGRLDPAAAEAFFEDWQAHGLTRINEWCAPETTFKALLDNLWRGENYPGDTWGNPELQYS